MPAKDTYHDAVRTALIRDGWTITHDPFTISFGNTDVYADLGAERPLAAEKADERIAVEVKSFLGASGLRDFELALGQSPSTAPYSNGSNRIAGSSSPSRPKPLRRSFRSRSSVHPSRTSASPTSFSTRVARRSSDG
jgi:hypothetical protein